MLHESTSVSQKSSQQEHFAPSRVASGLQALNASLERLEIAMSRVQVAGAGQEQGAAHARLAEENAQLIHDNQQLMQSLETNGKERTKLAAQFKDLSARLDKALSQIQALMRESA